MKQANSFNEREFKVRGMSLVEKESSDNDIASLTCKTIPEKVVCPVHGLIHKENIKVCFAASTGGHYEQLLLLQPLINKYNGFIITEKTVYQTSGSENSKIYYLRQVNRKEMGFPIHILGNIVKSLKIYIKEKPDIIVTTGVLSMIPICLIGKLFRKKLIYIESFAKITSPTLTGRFLYKFADQFYVQWEELLQFYPKAIYKGGIY